MTSATQATLTAAAAATTTAATTTKAVFCCHGCATAFAVLAACGLGHAATLRQAAVAAGHEPHPVPMIRAGDAAWDTPDGLARIGHRGTTGDTWIISWSIDGLHCPACTWVLERLPLLAPGIITAHVDAGRGTLRTLHDHRQITPSSIAAAVARLGYRLRPWLEDGQDQARRQRSRALATRAAVALACAVGAMQLAMQMTAGELTGDLDESWRRWFGGGALLLALPAGTWAVAPWWRALLTTLRSGRWSLDASAALVSAVGLSASAWHLLRGDLITYADAVAMFAALLLGGRLLLMRTHDRLAVEASHLHGLLPAVAVAEGSELSLDAGNRLPADGTVIAAQQAQIDRSVLSGESRPMPVQPGDQVFAGCILHQGRLTLRVTASGERTRIAGLLATAEAAARADRPLPATADPWERWYGPTLLLIAAITAWWGDVGRAMAVVMVACPCAIGLALPLARATAMAHARRHGLVIRDAGLLRRLVHLRRIVLDKTGTLTTGRMQVTAWEWLVPPAQRTALAAAIVAAERTCRHPVALAIEQHLGDVADATILAVRELPGRGLIAEVAPSAHQPEQTPWTLRMAPHTDGWIGIRRDDQPVARVQVHDGLRPDAPALVRQMRQSGCTVAIASGDAAPAVTIVADALAIAERHATQTPDDKAGLVDQNTLMIGDGVNDAAAFAAAGASVAISGGLLAGLTCADATVVDGQRPLAAVAHLLTLARDLQRRERWLLAMTLAYNAVAIAAAISGWWPPLICAIGMPLSSVMAVAIACRGWISATGSAQTELLHDRRQIAGTQADIRR